MTTPAFLFPLFLVAPLHAAPLADDAIEADRYPWRATLDLAACADCSPALRAGKGVLRIPIPPALRSARDPVDGSDLALLDAQGRPLSFAVARGEAPEEQVRLRVLPTEDRDLWLFDAGDRMLDGLDVSLGHGPYASMATVERLDGGRWVPHGQPTLLWRTDDSRQERISLPAVGGALRLRLVHLHHRPWGSPDIDGILRGAPHVDPVTWTVPVTEQALLESGQARYAAWLGHPVPVRSVSLVVDDPLFQRRASAVTVPLDLHDSDLVLAYDDGAYADGYAFDAAALYPASLDQTLRRVRLGGATLDEVTLPVQGPPADTLAVFIDSDGLVPLSVSALEASMPGLELLVVDPGPGPLTLLAGADPGTSPVSDAQVALPELSRAAEGRLLPGPREDNPDWLPPETRAGLALPSTVLSLDGLRWSHPVQGQGLVRIPVPVEALADSRGDLGDLRLVDGEGRQIPFLLRRRPHSTALETGPVQRSEDGPISRLRIDLPAVGASGDGPPVSAVELQTEAPVFARTVTLSRVRGAVLEPLRTYRWSGEDRPVQLRLSVDRPVGRQLVVEVDNGDDPPLPITGVRVFTPVWELVAVLPEGGGDLVYGDPDRQRPDYDLALLRTALTQRATDEAVVGERSALVAPPPSLAERGMVLGGLGVLIAGLGALILGLVRAVPEEEEEGAAEPKQPSVDPASDPPVDGEEPEG